MFTNCYNEILVALDNLIAKSTERFNEEFKANGRTDVFWNEVSYCDGLKNAKTIVEQHDDCIH